MNRPPIPPDRDDGHSSFIHAALIISERLSEIKPAQLLPAWLALMLIAAWPWPEAQRGTVALVMGLAWIGDNVMLALLPRLRRSWGPLTPPLLGLMLVRVALSWLAARWGEAHLGALPGLQAALSAVAVYATWIEPFAVRTPQLKLTHPALKRPLRLLHVSDVHFEHLSLRETKWLAILEREQPDVLLLTGDYFNRSSLYDPQARDEARALFAQLHAPLGVYAVTGSPVVDAPSIIPHCFSDLTNIQWLDDERLALPGVENVWLLGVRCTYTYLRDVAALRRLMEGVPPDAVTILLYHTPDLMPEAVKLGVTLYLAGHTHGGQIALPLFGPVFTSSRWGLKYGRGLFREKDTTLYVSRGLGVEGLGAPRARFCAPPEVGVWELQPAGDDAAHG